MKAISRYTLEPYRGPATRYQCPACHKERKFVRYIDTESGSHIDPAVGRCDREDNCGYHLKPRQFFEENPSWQSANNFRPDHRSRPKPAPKPPKITVVPVDVFKRTLADYPSNQFIQFLSSIFNYQTVIRLIERYFIGTVNKPWKGSVVWWQVDSSNRIRAGKVMNYHPKTGKRLKEPFDHITWMHKVDSWLDYQLSQCFFGEHLLKDKTKPVAIVESEKTAVIASVFYPDFIWIACGQLHGLNATKAAVLAGRKVVLFPDVKGYDKWAAKAKELAGITTITVSDFLERHATDAEKADGCDLADYLLKLRPPATAKDEPSATATGSPQAAGMDAQFTADLYDFYSMVDGYGEPCFYRCNRLVKRWFPPDRSYLKGEMQTIIADATGITFDKTERALNLLLETFAVYRVINTDFYKSNSYFKE